MTISDTRTKPMRGARLCPPPSAPRLSVGALRVVDRERLGPQPGKPARAGGRGDRRIPGHGRSLLPHAADRDACAVAGPLRRHQCRAAYELRDVPRGGPVVELLGGADLQEPTLP